MEEIKLFCAFMTLEGKIVINHDCLKKEDIITFESGPRGKFPSRLYQDAFGWLVESIFLTG